MLVSHRSSWPISNKEGFRQIPRNFQTQSEVCQALDFAETSSSH